MKRLGMLAIATTILLPTTLPAQHRPDRYERREWREWRRWHDREERVARVDALIVDAENRTDAFKRSLARALDRSRLDRSYREHRLNREASRLENAMDRLRRAWNRERDLYAARSNVRTAVYAGRDIERSLPRFALRRHIEAEWEALRRELNRLADAFDVPGIHD